MKEVSRIILYGLCSDAYFDVFTFKIRIKILSYNPKIIVRALFYQWLTIWCNITLHIN